MNEDSISPVARLRQERADFERSPSGGFWNGKDWAEHRATYAQLHHLRFWWEKFRYPPAGTPFCLCDEVAGAIDPEINRRDIRSSAEKIFARQDVNAVDGIQNSYVIDWIEGALRVFAEV